MCTTIPESASIFFLKIFYLSLEDSIGKDSEYWPIYFIDEEDGQRDIQRFASRCPTVNSVQLMFVLNLMFRLRKVDILMALKLTFKSGP